MTGLRSALFMAWFLSLTLVMAVIFLPLLAVPRKATVWMARYWARASCTRSWVRRWPTV